MNESKVVKRCEIQWQSCKEYVWVKSKVINITKRKLHHKHLEEFCCGRIWRFSRFPKIYRIRELHGQIETLNKLCIWPTRVQNEMFHYFWWSYLPYASFKAAASPSPNHSKLRISSIIATNPHITVCISSAGSFTCADIWPSQSITMNKKPRVSIRSVDWELVKMVRMNGIT